MSIVKSLLHASYKENLTTRFSAHEQNDFEGLFIFIHVAMATAYTSASLSKNIKFVLLTCLLPFLVTKGSRVFEKKVNDIQVSKTVLSHQIMDPVLLICLTTT